MKISGKMNAPSSGHPTWVQGLGKITGFFVLVGPLIGMVVWLAGAAIDGLIFYQQPGPRLGLFETISALSVVSSIAIPYGYLLGVVPAALAGLIIGAMQLRFGRLHWYVVMLVGAAVGVADIFIGKLLIGFLVTSNAPRPRPDWGSFVFPIVTCMVATLVCWRFVRDWYTERSASGQPYS
jgi:hypothetical protein